MDDMVAARSTDLGCASYVFSDKDDVWTMFKINLGK
jgi:hypothetical protein